MSAQSRYIGDEALTKRLVLDLDWPVDKGRIKDFDDMEVLFDSTVESTDEVAEVAQVHL